MEIPHYRSALIVGTGPGLSASLARLFAAEGLKVALAARNRARIAGLAAESGAVAHACDATNPAQVADLFTALDAADATPDLVVYNASGRVRGPVTELDPAEVANGIAVSAYGAFLVAQQAARRMLPRKHGAIALTGASASVKGFALSSCFAMGKFALRGLAQSLTRELGPHGIHVAHFVIDGGIRAERRPDPPDRPDSTLHPDAIARAYWSVLTQPRSAWTWELELRPWVEKF
jgi:NAD(P)-dependent dehydrogenase (short-subunit alcohol dehydrogenase family)